MADQKVEITYKEEDIMKLVDEQVDKRSKEIKAEFDGRVKTLSEEKDALDTEIQDGKRKAYEVEIATFVEGLEAKNHITPAALERVKTMVEPLNYNIVTKFSEEEINPIEAIKHGIVKLTELASKGMLILDDTQITKPGENQPQGSTQEQRGAAIATFMDESKCSYSDAWTKASSAEETKHLFIPSFVEAK